jgi:hypothetical protein
VAALELPKAFIDGYIPARCVDVPELPVELVDDRPLLVKFVGPSALSIVVVEVQVME